MSERKDPAPDAGKPAEEQGGPAPDRRPDPQAESTAAPEEPRASSGPAVPGEEPAAQPAAPSSTGPHGDPVRDAAASAGTPGGEGESAGQDGREAEAKGAGAGKAAEEATAKAATPEPPEGASSGEPKAEATGAGAEAAEKPGEGTPEAPAVVTEAAKEKVLRFDCSLPEQRAAGIEAAVDAVRQGKLVVIPTDTVYGIGADAFTPSAVSALLAAKGRGRDMPVPVLVGSVRAANALLDDLGPYGQDLIDAFWPGPLTIIGHAVRSLQWDLGETKGTVAVRMPLHAVALDLLKETGPMAVSSANRSGAPPATTIAEAEEQLGDSVAVYLDGGRCTQPIPSTIVDLTTPVPRVLRKGAISVEKLKSVVGYVATDD